MSKKLIYDYTLYELSEKAVEVGLTSFRGEQIFRAIYSEKVKSFAKITTLSKELRESLSTHYTFDAYRETKSFKSTDSSIKFLFKLLDGNSVEAVFMPWLSEENELIRSTLCISSQAGCALGCTFCATGTLGLIRNLSPGEIVCQVIEAEKLTGQKIDNIVFMGMGEPFQNYTNVMKSVNILSDKKAGLLSRKRITVSTSGVVPKIYAFADEKHPPKLAISLHATTNGVREKIMPIAEKWQISELMDAIEYYYRNTKMPVTYEYIPFDGLNDSIEDAKRLSKISKRVPSRINIIPFNDISFTSPQGIAKELKPTPIARVLTFADEIRQFGGVAIVRDTFGIDINAACGQLALSEKGEAVIS